MWCLKRDKKQVKTVRVNKDYFDDEKLRQRMVEMYQTVKIETIGKQKRDHIAWYIKKAKAGRQRYETVSRYLRVHLAIDVDWRIVAAIHAMECSFDFSKGIHSGEPFNRVTRLVPKGRGPFQTFEEACLDAFEIKKCPDKFDVPGALIFLLSYNGFGYYYKGLPSPYLWAYTNHQPVGKYVRDGVFDPKAISLQVGAALILKELGFE